MNLITNSPRKILISTIISISLLTSCDSDNNSAELAKAVELENLRTNGTIIEQVTIVNDQTRLRANETHQLSATGLDSNGDTRDVTSELTWTSSDTSIATVNSSGSVTAVASSDIDQGKVIITGTTVNDIFDEGEISVSDNAVSAITLKQTSPETGNINTCIDASIKGDVSYEDGYISLNSVKDMAFTLDDQTSAVISTDGTLYTSAEGTENITITSTIDSISAELTVTADPSNLDSIGVYLADEDYLIDEDEEATSITLAIGERVQLYAQAKLIESVSEDSYDINPSVNWLQSDTDLLGITAVYEDDNDDDDDDYTYKGTILALSGGTTLLTASCGGIETNVIVVVEGTQEFQSLEITDADNEIVDNSITINSLESIELTVTASYDTTSTSLNLTEFTTWKVIGNDVVSLELFDYGTSDAYYKLTSTSSSDDSIIILFTYNGEVTSLSIEIED